MARQIQTNRESKSVKVLPKDLSNRVGEFQVGPEMNQNRYCHQVIAPLEWDSFQLETPE